MDVSTPDGSMRVAPDEIAIAPHPAWPDNVLIGLCTRFRDRLTQWSARVVAWQSSVPRTNGSRDELIQLKCRWEADLVAIRSMPAQTLEGAAARYRVAGMLIEWSAAGDGMGLEFLSETMRDEAILEAEVMSQAKQLSESQDVTARRGLLERMFSRADPRRVTAKVARDARLPA